jgi:Fe-S cluster assembly protein SufD
MEPMTKNFPVDIFVEQFERSETSFAPEFIRLKKDAINNFKQLGFPTTKNEEWKYTSIAALLKTDFHLPDGKAILTREDVEKFFPLNDDAIQLVFENGKYCKALSTSELPKGIIAGNLFDYSNHDVVKKHFGQMAKLKNESFVALNTAMFSGGAFIFAEKNVVCEKTVHLIFINDSRLATTVNHPRNLIVASMGSSIKVTENYFSVASVNSSFSNPVSEIFIDDDAKVEYTKFENESAIDYHIDYTSAVIRRDATLNIHTITTGGNLVRNNLNIELLEKNGSAFLNGLYITSDGSHIDNHSFVDHSSPFCYSNELYKGLLFGKSQGVFNGKIFVRKDAQKTNAYQSNKTILLSDDASMNAKPQLEIYADDVKCSHGATTGQIDEEALFYLRSRGIGIDEASALLTNAFAEEILDKIAIPSYRDMLKQLIQKKLTNLNS